MAVTQHTAEISRNYHWTVHRPMYPRAMGTAWMCCLLVLLASGGCSIPRFCCEPTSTTCDELLKRAEADPCDSPGSFILPPDVCLGDDVTEDEAVATALANNSAFQSTLAQLGMAEGDLIQAGLITNPNLLTFFPVSVKQWEWTLYVPIETFILRKQRVGVAESQYENIAQQLEQNGLNLMRDVRVAHADLALAIAQWKLALEAERIRGRIAELTEKRLSRGDISELEAITARVDVLNARVNAALFEQTVVVARSRLALLMGLPQECEVLEAQLTRPPHSCELDEKLLINAALETRPDLQAARWAVDAAARRARLSRWLWLRVDGVADANSRGDKGFEAGPGLRVDIPIFNRNQGGVTRAEAELDQALHQRDYVYEQIVQEVRAATAQWVQASEQLAILEQEVGPSIHTALDIAEKGFSSGGADYLLVLQTTTQYLDARARILDQIAALRRARAELERSIAGPMPIRAEEVLENQPEELPLPAPEEDGAPAEAEEID